MGKAKAAKTKGGKGAFGGVQLSFKGQAITLEQLYGDKPIGPHMLAKTLWAHIKKQGLRVA